MEQKLFEIAETMNDIIDRGLRKEGILPGGLNVKRRAKSIYDSLQKEKGNNLTYSATEINNKGLLCYFHGADLNIDLEAGFFEEGGFLYPKALGLTMTIKASNNQLGKLIYELNNKNHLVNKVDSINWPLGITYDNVLTSSVAAAETLGE